MRRLLRSAPWLFVLLLPGSAIAQSPVLGPRQSQIHAQVCARCHVKPGLGVPILGDEAEWQTRRAQGFDTLLANTVNGIRNMPPLGTCGHCTEDDLRRLVAFLAGMPLPESEDGSER